LFGSVTLTTQQDNQERLVVSESAVIDSGIRQIVLRQRGVGLFEPKEVKLGLHANGYWEVLSGLELGDEVVTRANFLLDAESNLKSVLDSLGSAAKEMPTDSLGDQ
jgi:Cu(I)/Ag(I) efflux system membrane fusion protein